MSHKWLDLGRPIIYYDETYQPLLSGVDVYLHTAQLNGAKSLQEVADELTKFNFHIVEDGSMFLPFYEYPTEPVNEFDNILFRVLMYNGLISVSTLDRIKKPDGKIKLHIGINPIRCIKEQKICINVSNPNSTDYTNPYEKPIEISIRLQRALQQIPHLHSTLHDPYTITLPFRKSVIPNHYTVKPDTIIQMLNQSSFYEFEYVKK